MKQNYLFKSLLTGAVMASAGFANAQCFHPLAFGAAASTSTNYYADYVGERFEITAPAAVAGDKIFTTPNDGSGATGTWGGFATIGPPNDQLMHFADSLASPSGVALPDATGKVALLYRGGGIEFGQKALSAQAANAVACIIVNNVAGGPVGMAAGSVGSSVTIPVFMISKADGDALNSQLWNGVNTTLAVFNWGQGNLHDLGFVSRGIAQWHNGAIPSYELTAGGDPIPYRGFDGAYVANFGSSDESNVWLEATTSFTPTGGSAAVVHKDSVNLAAFPQADSIWAMYCQQYNLGSSITGTGTINVDYNLYSPGVIDQFPFDNTTSYSVQVTDNVYTKGRWDAANSRPYCTTYTGSGADASGAYQPYVWGPSFYVQSGRYAATSTFSLVLATSTGINWIIPATNMNIYLFKWVDGANGEPVDNIMQNAEMELQAIAVKSFNGSTDSSFQYFTATYSADTGAVSGAPGTTLLAGGNWYWVAAEMPQNSTTSWAIGCDGVNNGYPRLVGRDTFNTFLEYYTPLWGSGDRGTSTNNMFTYPDNYLSIVPYAGTSFVTSIDSTVFSNEKGLIPNISLSTSMWPTSTASTIKTKVNEFSLFPNPTSGTVNVNLALDQQTNTVTYKILSTTGKVLSTETHTNVTNDTYSFNTEKLANGIYYMVVNAGDHPMFKKFTVMH